jgi:hypothetical protein
MADLTDLLELFELQSAIATHTIKRSQNEEAGKLLPESNRRITDTNERLKDLEKRHERMHLVTAALWQLLKAHTGLTDEALKQYIEKVDLADGKLDGKITKKGAAIDCPNCSRRILKSAVVCPWCTKRLKSGDPFGIG